jgi:predicted metalloprotease with PDZ domain/uncharacterized membrane protein
MKYSRGMPANAAFLKDIALFNSMDDAEREAIAQLMDEVRFDAGKQIFHERDQGGICYVIRSGRVELSVEDPNKEKLIVDVLDPGELCGELSLLDGGNRSTTAVALTDVEALVLEREELVTFLRKQPDASLDIMAALAKRIRRADALIKQRVQDPNALIEEKITFGDRLADSVAAFGGSWRFIILFTTVMFVWMGLNLVAGAHFDPYPFILLNLCLSALAALQAPVIMMSQNRQDAKDRIRSEADYRVNVRSEVEIAELHEKLERMRGELNIQLTAIAKKVGGAAAVLLLLLAGGSRAHASEVKLAVDASETPRRILHVRETIPVKPGALTLHYPKWIPGEHAPNGPVRDVAGVTLTAGGKSLAWQHDPVDMYAIHCDVPAGASSVELAFDYLGRPDHEGFSNGSSMTAELGVYEWNLTVMAPEGKASEIQVRPSLKLPAGWKWGSALEAAHESGGTVEFKPVSLETLVDSPVIAGAHYRAVALGKEAPPHEIDLAADSAHALDAKPETIASWKKLVAEAGALYGAHHYRRYHFLLALSDHVAHFGLEHHQSSDNRVDERSLIDDELTKLMSSLLPHEFTHSWNGKFRRPADLTTTDFSQPMKGSLLWVYEGLTNYLGVVLDGRAGSTPEWVRDDLALMAAGLEYRPGRAWRPLGDTAVAAQVLYGSGPEWASWRRGVDFYPEGTMIWLEADAILRKQTNGARSLDDFCKKFHGGGSGAAEVVTYTRDDVVRTLGEVAPYDWKGFLAQRIDAAQTKPPLAGIEAAGWRLKYSDTPNQVEKAWEKASKAIRHAFSIGILMKEDGTILDTVEGLPAAKAGIGPGMKLLAVNGRKWSPPVLADAIAASKQTPVELLVENAEYIRPYKLAYSGGLRFPHLERDASRSDLLTDILKPRTN